jgi:hypothetical protein
MPSLPLKPSSDATRRLIDYARDDNEIPVFRDGADKNWYRGEISPEKWNKSFPYQLRILKLQKNGSYELATVPGAVFTLPIPPEALTVSIPFAINTTITLGGSIEEHNGAPIRMISLSGSLGVAFGRDQGDATKSLDFAESIFAGTIQAAQQTKKAFDELTSTGKAHFNVHDESEFEGTHQLGKLTGFYQFRLIQGFLESYVELKKSAAQDARFYRLAFCMWKDEQIYLVQPMSFEGRRSANSPLEYMYSLQLKATKRIEFNRSVGEIAHAYEPVQRDPSKLARLLTSIEKARQVLQGAKKTIQAVGGDINTVLFGTMRELTLFAKDALAVPLSMADLSDSVVQEAKSAVIALTSTGSALANFPQNAQDRGSQTSREARELGEQMKQLAGETGDDPNLDRAAHPANSPFENPTDNLAFFGGIQVGDLNLSPATISKIADERDRVRKMTRLEFEQRRDVISTAVNTISRSLGLGHPVFDRTFGVESPTTTAVDVAREDDFDVLFSMNALLVEMNRLVVTNENEPQSKLDTLATVAGLAERSGIAFRVPRSKYAVPFPYGSTLEMLSARYLGDPNRWHEIAVLNGLKAPFVDEEGFTLPLLVNGADNTVVVGDSSKLFVGQTVWIQSEATARTRRRLRKVEQLTPGQYLLTLDGDPDLERFITLAEASLFAFTPNTVNSQQLIYIPSDTEPRDDDFKSKGVPGLTEHDPMIAVGGVDLLLTPQNDLVITPDGDTRWSVGLTNIVQKIRLAISVRKGALNQHEEYGLPIEAGASIADLEPSDVVRSIESMFNADDSFAGVKAAQVRIEGPLARVGVAIQVRGTDRVIPVSVEVQQ